MRPFPVRLPSGTRYWTVIDDDLRPVPVADAYLRHVRFGRDDAESTTKSYAGAVALYLTWCVVAHLDWWLAADRLGSFMLWLRHTPSHGGRPGASVVLAGPGADEVRGPRRINAVLADWRTSVSSPRRSVRGPQRFDKPRRSVPGPDGRSKKVDKRCRRPAAGRFHLPPPSPAIRTA